MKLIYGLAFCLSLMACASTPEKSQRDVAATTAANPLEYCADTFNAATGKLQKLVAAQPEVYPRYFGAHLEAATRRAKSNVICVNSTITPYGVETRKSEPQIVVENPLRSLNKLIDSDMGVAAFKRYQIDARSAYYDHMLVALAAHAYAEVIGLDDSKYELFFVTLKALEK